MSAPSSPQVKILFVCMGNICRSPAAECVFVSLLEKAGMLDKVLVDSAGTTAYHTGDPPDQRMQAELRRRHYPVRGKARPVTAADYTQFDLILAMDEANLRDLQTRRPAGKSPANVQLFGQYCPNFPNAEIPDPYYGGEDGFGHVVDMLEDGCQALLNELRESLARE